MKRKVRDRVKNGKKGQERKQKQEQETRGVEGDSGRTRRMRDYGNGTEKGGGAEERTST